MALSVTQLARLASVNANQFGYYSRTNGDVSVGRDEGIDYHLRQAVVEVLEWLKTEGAKGWIIHDRQKVAFRVGEKPTLTVSKDDGGRVNGWFVGEIRTSLENARSTPSQLPASIEVIYQYGYSTGTDGATLNSQDIFDRNVRDFEKAILAVQELAGCYVTGIRQGDRGIGAAGDGVAHYYTAQILVNLCNI